MKQIGNLFFPDREKHFQKFADDIRGYQKAQRDYAYQFVDDWKCAVDVGANVGIFSCDFANYFEKVVAIEPLRDNIACLERNVPENVEIVRCAVGNREGQCEMALPGSTLGNAYIVGVTGGAAEDGKLGARDIEKVDLKTIDSLNLENVNLIKIDVQGAELVALQGAVETIKRCRPVIMLEEKAEGDGIYQLAEAEHLLESLGMTPMDRVGADRIFIFVNGRNITVPKRPTHLVDYVPRQEHKFPIAPTFFSKWHFDPSWAGTDIFYAPKGAQSHPNHHCKVIFLASKPFIKSFKNAIDIGCRDGEYTRYLQSCFKHVYGFDPRRRDAFNYNVDLRRATHFNCALGDVAGTITMYGGTHDPRNAAGTTVPCLTLDSFGLEDISYVKVDVEGFEEKVLKGGQKTIFRDRPVIVIEQNEATLAGADMFGAKIWLEQNGYKHVATCPRGCNFIMAPVS